MIVTYYRVSTKKQGDSGLGLEAQRSYIYHFHNKGDIIAEFTDIESGKQISNRKELQKAIELCKKTGATLVVAKIDRLSRNTEEALLIFKELDGRLVSCDIPNLDKFTLTLFMAIADRERELISIRTKQALTERIKRSGEWRTGSTPFKDGSATTKATETRKSISYANQNNKRAASLILQLRKSGKRWTEIVNELNENGFLTSRGKLFRVVQVQRLHNRTEKANVSNE